MKNAYSVIADYYDGLMSDFDYNGYYAFIKPYIYGNVLELACGSGAFTKLLIKSCESIIAVDNCQDMLNRAVENNFKDRRYITFINSNMLNFKPMRPMNAIVCVCDGVNYINHLDINILFSNVYSNLLKDGYFVFDISTSHKLREIIGNNVFYEDNDDFTYLWTNTLTESQVDMDIAMFKRVDDKYTRVDECHTQYIHQLDDLIEVLCNVGFEVQVFDGEKYGKVHDNSNRLLFVCKRG